MSRIVTIVLFVVCACSALALDVQSEVKAVYAKWAACTKAMDLEGLMALLHPSFRQIDINGTSMGFKEMKEMMKSYVGSMKDCTASFDFERIDGFGNEASVWLSFTMKFKQKQGSKWVEQTFSAKQYETLVKTAKGWQFTSSQDLPH